jgi:hypothetical protein
MPAEYYGGNSGRYFPEGSSELVPADHAYGKTVATSHGVVIDGNQMGPNLAPYSGSSGTLTGGARKRKSKSRSGKKLKRSSSKFRSGKKLKRSSSKSRSGKKKRSTKKSKSIKKSRGRKTSRTSKSRSHSRSGKKSRGKKSSSSRRRRRLSSRSEALRRREKRLSSRSRRVRRRERRLSSTARRIRNKKRSGPKMQKKKQYNYTGKMHRDKGKRSYGYAEPTYGDRY